MVYSGLSGLFFYAFHDSYWRHRACFNELGRCFDAQAAVVYTDGGMVWGLFAATFAALALVSLIRLRH